MHSPTLRLSLLLCLSVWAVGGVHAQTTPPNAPMLIDRDRIDRKIEDRKAQTATPKAPAPKAAAGAVAITPFVLKAVEIKGAKSVDPAHLSDAYKDRIGKNTTIKDIGAISEAIGAVYEAEGLPLYSVVIPNQSFNNGVLAVRVTEGYVDNVVIDGDTKDADLDLVRAYAAKIVADRPLHHAVLARYLLLMNDIPGLKVGSRFDPAANNAGVTLRLTVERKHFDFGLAFDNEGSKYISRLQFTATATANSIVQQGDRTELIYGLPADYRDYQYYGLTHLEPIGTEGTTVEGTASYLHTRPVDSVINGDAYMAGVTFSVPIVRQQEDSVFLIGSFNALNSANGFLGQTFSNERTRVIRAGVAYVTGPLDGSKLTSLTFILSQGVDMLGARPGGLGTGGPTFTKVNFRVDHERTLGPKFIVRVKASGQFAPDAVPASEEYTYGGNDFGRAFGDDEVVGDRGVEGGAELAYRLPTAWTGATFLSDAEAYGFYDIGKLWTISPLLRSPDLGQSAGVGARVKVYGKVTLQLEAGFPVECPSATNNCSAGRGIVNLTSKF